MRSKDRRQALIVLGMHRTGTSALSGVLSALGVQSPKTLMPATKDNPKGYWESVALMGLHDEVLSSAGTTWSDWDRFNPDWMDSPVAGNFRDRLSAVLKAEYGQSEMFLVKDPRICRLLPLWLAVLDDLDISPRIVLPVRHPMEVARSLMARNEFGHRRSLLIWLRHVLDAEHNSRGRQRVFVDYEALLDDWRPQVRKISEALDIKWPKWSAKVEAEVDRFLSGELRHQVVAVESLKQGSELDGWVTGTHRSLLKLVAGGSGIPEATAQLDEVRHDLDRSCSIYASVLQESEFAAAERLNQETSQLDVKTKECDELSVNRERALADVLRRDEAIAALKQEMQDAVTAQKREMQDAVAAEKQKAEAQAADMRAEIATLGVEQEKRLAELKAVHSSEIEQLRHASARSEESLGLRTAELARLTAITFELQDSMSDRDRKMASLQSELRQAKDGQRRASVEHKNKADALHGKIKRERDLRSSERSEARARFRAMAHALAIYREAADDRENRIKQLLASKAWRASNVLRRMTGSSVAGMATSGNTLEMEVIRDSGLFDRDWYLQRYPDVREDGIDPVEHFLNHGAQERRDPGPGFSTQAYLSEYDDVTASGLNPLLHYIWYGIGEGRSACPVDEGKAAG